MSEYEQRDHLVIGTPSCGMRLREVLVVAFVMAGCSAEEAVREAQRAIDAMHRNRSKTLRVRYEEEGEEGDAPQSKRLAD